MESLEEKNLPNNEEIKQIIATNLVEFRKKANLTQMELAEKLNYSDKSISKWERGESLPDVLVLKQLADFYKVTLDDFTKPFEEIAPIKEKEKKLGVFAKIIITIASICMVWVVATAVYVFTNIITNVWTSSWLCFIYAIPISMIVFVVFSCIWWNSYMRCMSISLLVWSILLTIYLTMYAYDVWLIFVIGVPVQVLLLLLLWYKVVRKKGK